MVPDGGDVEHVIVLLDRCPDFVATEFNGTTERLQGCWDDENSGFMVRMPFLRVREIHQIRGEGVQELSQPFCAAESNRTNPDLNVCVSLFAL